MQTFLLFLLLLTTAPLVSESLTISIVGRENDSAYAPFLRVIVRAFKQYGFSLVFKSYPGERGLIEANAGRIDGDLARLPSVIAAHYPNLLIVPEPLAVVSNMVYSTKKRSVNSVDDIIRQNLRVGTYLGLKWAELNVKPKITADNWSATATYEQALKMLLYGRVDIVIATNLAIQRYLAMPEYESVKPVGNLVTVKVYMCLNKKWSTLVPKVAQEIRKFKTW